MGSIHSLWRYVSTAKEREDITNIYLNLLASGGNQTYLRLLIQKYRRYE